ncbi:MAG TPA: PRC-barrel domain-containing protein [Dongiaceae bacterium]|nr:PRC-barrel domain-containing protein [Dongiaceae bacterium]
MAHYGTLKNTTIGEASEDIRGSHLYGVNDDKLGKIDDVVFDHSTGDIRYAVIDTGGWLSSKKFLVPAEKLRPSAKHKDDFEADLTKQQVESFPPYNESDLDSESKWSGYEREYRSKWVTDPVMHRAETDRNITPTTKQTTGNIQSEEAAARAHGEPVVHRMPAVSTSSPTSSQRSDLEAADRPTGRVVPAGTDTVVISSNAEGIGGRWDTFQSRLRERRKEAVASCNTCAGSISPASESIQDLRKAV